MADNAERLKQLTKDFLGRQLYVVHTAPNAPREELDRLLPEHLEHQIRLEKSGMPLVFATGYGRASIEPRWHRYPILQKPYSTDEVSRALAAVLEPVAFEGGGLPDKSVRAPL
mgnify:CR=1 FL=1